jgi:hypothetical protein
MNKKADLLHVITTRRFEVACLFLLPAIAAASEPLRI